MTRYFVRDRGNPYYHNKVRRWKELHVVLTLVDKFDTRLQVGRDPDSGKHYLMLCTYDEDYPSAISFKLTKEQREELVACLLKD